MGRITVVWVDFATVQHNNCVVLIMQETQSRGGGGGESVRC